MFKIRRETQETSLPPPISNKKEPLRKFNTCVVYCLGTSFNEAKIGNPRGKLKIIHCIPYLENWLSREKQTVQSPDDFIAIFGPTVDTIAERYEVAIIIMPKR